MNIFISSAKLKQTQTDTVVFWGKEAPAWLTAKDKKRFKEESKKQYFKGKLGETLVIDISGMPFKKIIISGLGKNINPKNLRRSVGFAIKAVKNIGGGILGLSVPKVALTSEDIGMALSEGVILSNYSFDKYKSKKFQKGIIKKVIVFSENKNVKLNEGIKKGKAFANGTILSRDLVNEPGSAILPKDIVEEAKKIATSNDRISVSIFDKKRLQREGFGGILGIARASDDEPYFIHLTYKPLKKFAKTKKIALAGKGITFDSGGLSIKSSQGMELMKMDMAGASVVLGVFSSFKDIKPGVEVHGFISTCDNILGPKSVKPGDVIKAYNGKTIEVLNTDAEGRIVLADALSYASKQNMDVIIDIATLTGSCLHALGTEIGALFSNDDKLAKELLDASEKAGEQLWRLPIVEEYRDSIKKNCIADVRNLSTIKEAGAITAALFLEEFVSPKIKWAHFDIAGSAFYDQSTDPLVVSGATGHPVRTLLHYLLPSH